MSAIEKAIDSLMPGEPVTYLNLSVYPLFGFVTGQPDYLTLDEALAKGLIEVAEVSESGHVPELKVINRDLRVVHAIPLWCLAPCANRLAIDSS